jgi:putative transposase
MNRGAAKQRIFQNTKHYKIFLHLLNELHSRFQVKIHAYCLMPNHYHLLIQTPLANLSCAMRHLNSLYTRKYNVSQNRDGPLLRGRFKSILVDSDNYLLQVSRYVHRNPIVANLAQRAEDYRWSSYQAYLNSKLQPQWLSIDETLDKFGPKNKIQNYRKFVNEVMSEVDNSHYILDKFLQKPILGSDAFIKSIYEKYIKDKKISIEISQQNYLNKELNIEQIMQAVIDHYQIEKVSLMDVKRKQGNKPRKMAIYLAVQLSGQTYQTIARTFTNTTTAGVAKTYQRISQAINTNNNLAREIALLKKLLLH